MKYSISFLSIVLIFFVNTVIAQDHIVTASGGYSFAKIDGSEQSASGWRINLLYEYAPGKLSHGVAIGYIQTSATVDEGQSTETEFKAGNGPIYYVPKYTFLENDSFRPFIKGALGIAFSNYDRTGPILGVQVGDTGFYGGLGAGIYKKLGGLVSINVEYEWVYIQNSWFKNGFMNSVMAGVGFNF